MQAEIQILKALKSIFDPEIPVNIYDLGLIYEISVEEDGIANITMTLTAPGCPMADQIMAEVNQKVGAVDGVSDVKVNLTFNPPWSKDLMSEEAKLELGFL
ncbi:MAG: iron-sulfur cluster assembly protein [Bacteroidota bacterium]|nr:iron-sulfur cluster assembly protein [Bacteroidota bacterium]